MYFQVTSTYPRDKTLADEHEAFRQLDAGLNRQRQAAKLQKRLIPAGAALDCDGKKPQIIFAGVPKAGG